MKFSVGILCFKNESGNGFIVIAKFPYFVVSDVRNSVTTNFIYYLQQTMENYDYIHLIIVLLYQCDIFYYKFNLQPSFLIKNENKV